jgi:hypothetical protein
MSQWKMPKILNVKMLKWQMTKMRLSKFCLNDKLEQNQKGLTVFADFK